MPTTPTFLETWQALDASKIEQAILLDPKSGQNLMAHEYEDAKAMTFTAAEKWLMSDLTLLDPPELEAKFLNNWTIIPVIGFVDLMSKYKIGEHIGKRLVVDWKSSSGDLDVNWQQKLIDSHQWRLYAQVTGAHHVSYRGVNAKGKTREVYLNAETMPHLNRDVAEYFNGISRMVNSLLEFDKWPQNMPAACGAYNQICPFKDDCENGREPRYLIPIRDLTLSYSSAGRFLQCPEKFRRMKVLEKRGDETEATRMGGGFHRGIEEVYRQAFKLQ